MHYLMQAGNLAYVPVVNTSTAAGMWKFGRRACTKVSRAILASISAVSTNSIDCLSKKLIICYKETIHNKLQAPKLYERFQTKLTADLSTLDAELAHFTSANSRMNSCRVRAEKL